MLPLQRAVLVVGATWLVNQAIGFGLLGYPIEIHTILWGLVIGEAALIATVIAAFVFRGLQRTGGLTALGLALIGAYAAYELIIFSATFFLGGAVAFTAAIVGRLGLLSVLWLIGLIMACEVFRLLNPVRRHQMMLS